MSLTSLSEHGLCETGCSTEFHSIRPVVRRGDRYEDRIFINVSGKA